MRRLPDLDAMEFAALFAPIVSDAASYLRTAGMSDAQITVLRRLDMRYQGQGYELEVALPEGDAKEVFAQLPKLFAAAYERVFGMSFLTEPIEIVNWKVEVRGPFPKQHDAHVAGVSGKGAMRKGEREAYFPEFDGFKPCAVYDRYALKPGDTIVGPAFIEENESTCVVGVGDKVMVDRNLNLVVEISS